VRTLTIDDTHVPRTGACRTARYVQRARPQHAAHRRQCSGGARLQQDVSAQPTAHPAFVSSSSVPMHHTHHTCTPPVAAATRPHAHTSAFSSCLSQLVGSIISGILPSSLLRHGHMHTPQPSPRASHNWSGASSRAPRNRMNLALCCISRRSIVPQFICPIVGCVAVVHCACQSPLKADTPRHLLLM
jgi:hypothetical protein